MHDVIYNICNIAIYFRWISVYWGHFPPIPCNRIEREIIFLYPFDRALPGIVVIFLEEIAIYVPLVSCRTHQLDSLRRICKYCFDFDTFPDPDALSRLRYVNGN